jgi:ribosomal protein S18 acetylase RimI-like enzyme
MPVVDKKDLVVRRVLPVDLRACAELLVKSLERRGAPPDADRVRNTVQSALEDSQRVLVVGAYHEHQPGFAHGKMVGVLVMSAIPSVEHAGELGWIETLFVRPDYRKLGLGEQMLAQALTWSHTRGFRHLDLEVGEGDDSAAAARLYQKHGFRARTSSRLALDLG